MDIQEQLQAYQKSHKSQIRWFIGIAIGIILLLIFLHFYGPGTTVIFADDKTTKVLMDSIKVHDRQRTIEFQQLQLIHQQDSIRIDNLEDDLSNTQSMLNKLNSKYAKERTNLDNSSANTRLQYLSNHLPKVSH